MKSKQSRGDDSPRAGALSALGLRVFLVAAVSLVPVALLSAALLVSNAREQREHLYRGAEDTVYALLNAVDAELKSTAAALDAFAASPRLARGDFDRLREEALQLLARRPSWVNVVVSTPDAVQLMNARVPEGVPLPSRLAPESIARAAAARRPVVGRVLYSPVVKQFVVAVLVPVERDGVVRYVITGVIRPESILELIDLQKLARHGVISILDQEQRAVARSLNHPDAVGKPPSDDLLKLMQQRGEGGRGVTRTLEGKSVYTVFRRSPYSGWTVAMGISRDAIDSPLRRSYAMLGGAIIISILLGLGAALLVGRGIVRPMRELEENAERVGVGEAPQMPRTRLSQVRRVGAALVNAHAQREDALHREREARLAAEQANKAKDEFLAMLGHELRNPLAAISNASLIIEKHRESLGAQVASATGIIGRQAKHLSRITDDLLDAGRVILGKISLAREPVDLAAAVRTTLDALRSSGRLAGHTVDTQLETQWVNADPTRLEQVISNLFINAVKYTPASGRIAVLVTHEAGAALLRVDDTGIGLEPDLLPRVFDLFVQGERALDRAQGGLGIGLTVVRRLVELHGGTVRAQSAGTGKGSSFMVSLPAIDAPPVRAPDKVPASTRSREVAVIEDNADARSSLRMLLELDGHRVHEAEDGPAGIALLEANLQIDFAIVDIGLPGASGYAVAQAVRRARGDSVRLVAMSGYGAERDIDRGRQAGFDAYLIKPVDSAVLRRELASGS
ncbi:MAG TPA: ATP-binding protein [Steroidobacteraceae bacterium]|nr:ATP-binding protein [Steroidobacteraceae bacterium]